MKFLYLRTLPWHLIIKIVIVIIGCFVVWHYGIVYGLFGMRPEHHITIQKDYDGALVGRINDVQKRREIASQTIYRDCRPEGACTPWSPFAMMHRDVPGGTKQAFKDDVMSSASMYGPNWPIHLPTPARFEASSLIDQAISAPHAKCMFNGQTEYFCLDPESGAFVYRYR